LTSEQLCLDEAFDFGIAPPRGVVHDDAREVWGRGPEQQHDSGGPFAPSGRFPLDLYAFSPRKRGLADAPWRIG